jgi:cellulose synthase/poly-beta-1,6-N-acetylglucosamine synthase-like glycosyltransferase
MDIFLGADMMIRNSVLDKSLFDCDMYYEGEAQELTWRIKKLGYKIVSALMLELFTWKWVF